jgi:hypothetical protein
MKRIITFMIAAVIILAMSGIGYADVTWPPAKAGLKSKLSCGKQSCAVFTAGRGQINIECAQANATGGWGNIKSFECPTVGNKQVCKNKTTGMIVKVNPYDTDSLKCTATCGPCSGGYK